MNGQAPIPLHFSVEFAWAVESDTYPKTDFHNLQLRGPLNTQAFIEAFDEMLPTYPVAHCRLEERRVGLSRRLFWVPRPGKNSLIVEDCRDRVTQPVDPVAFIQEYFRPYTARRINLFEDFPFRFYLLRLADDLHLFSLLYHHIALDAAVGYVFMKDIFARYHEKVTGEKPAWAAVSATNTARNPDVEVKPMSMFAFVWELVSLLRKYPRSAVSLIATSGTRDLFGRNMNRAIFEGRTLQGIKFLLRKHRATLVDVLLAAIFQAIGSWDREHKLPQETMRALLAVNIRSRLPEAKGQSVALSGLRLIFTRPEEVPFETLVQQIRDERIQQLDKGVDVAMFKGLEAFTKLLRFLPVRIRAAISRRLLTAPITFILSNVGIMWPEVKDGKLTGRSAFTRAGDIELDDVHSCPSFSPDVGMGIVTRTLGERLFINYSTDRRRFTKEEADAITSRISEAIRSLDRYAEEPPEEAEVRIAAAS